MDTIGVVNEAKEGNGRGRRSERRQARRQQPSLKPTTTTRTSNLLCFPSLSTVFYCFIFCLSIHSSLSFKGPLSAIAAPANANNGRIRVLDTSRPPFSAVVHLNITFGSGTSSCSGVLLTRTSVLTAASCLLRIATTGNTTTGVPPEWVDSVMVYPARNGAVQPFPALKVRDFHLPRWFYVIAAKGKGYTLAAAAYDYAIVRLVRPADARIAIPGRRPGTAGNLTLVGYPLDKAVGTMWSSKCTASSSFTFSLSSALIACDSAPGQQGGPVFWSVGGPARPQFIVGIVIPLTWEEPGTRVAPINNINEGFFRKILALGENNNVCSPTCSSKAICTTLDGRNPKCICNSPYVGDGVTCFMEPTRTKTKTPTTTTTATITASPVWPLYVRPSDTNALRVYADPSSDNVFLQQGSMVIAILSDGRQVKDSPFPVFQYGSGGLLLINKGQLLLCGSYHPTLSPIFMELPWRKGASDGYVARLLFPTSTATDWQFDWIATFGTQYLDRCEGIGGDASGNIYIRGSSGGVFGTDNLLGVYFHARLQVTGSTATWKWGKSVNGSDFFFSGFAVHPATGSSFGTFDSKLVGFTSSGSLIGSYSLPDSGWSDPVVIGNSVFAYTVRGFAEFDSTNMNLLKHWGLNDSSYYGWVANGGRTAVVADPSLSPSGRSLVYATDNLLRLIEFPTLPEVAQLGKDVRIIKTIDVAAESPDATVVITGLDILPGKAVYVAAKCQGRFTFGGKKTPSGVWETAVVLKYDGNYRPWSG